MYENQLHLAITRQEVDVSESNRHHHITKHVSNVVNKLLASMKPSFRGDGGLVGFTSSPGRDWSYPFGTVVLSLPHPTVETLDY